MKLAMKPGARAGGLAWPGLREVKAGARRAAYAALAWRQSIQQQRLDSLAQPLR